MATIVTDCEGFVNIPEALFSPSSNGFGGTSEMFGNIMDGLTALIDESDGFLAKLLRKPSGRFRFFWHSNNPFLVQHDGESTVRQDWGRPNLDGRNRAAACKVLGIEPKTAEYTGTETDQPPEGGGFIRRLKARLFVYRAAT